MRQSFAIQRQQIADAAFTAESASTACTSEEETIYAAAPLNPVTERQGRIYLRGLLKRDSLAQR